jgi:tetratricopeptide (TPR) repeat protein
MGELSAAKGYCDQAAALIGKAGSDKSPPALGLRIVRGRIALSEGRLEDARAAFTGAVGDPPQLNATALLGRSEVELAAGRLPAAEADARLALTRAQYLQHGLPYSYKTGLAWFLLGRIFVAESDPKQGRAAFESSVLHLSNTVDDAHPALREARRLLGNSGL